jgi:hypothetical protein
LIFSRSIPTGLRGLIQDWHGGGSAGSLHWDSARVATAARMIDMMDLDRRYADGPAEEEMGSTHRPGDAARAWAARLIQEIRRSYDYARRELNCPQIDLIALAGEGAIIRNLDRYLYVNLNLEVALLNPTESFDADARRQVPFGGLELTIPLGAALRSRLNETYQIDLTPPRFYQRIRKRRLIRDVSVTSALLLTACLLGAAMLWVRSRNQASLRAAYEAANRTLYPYVTRLAEEETKLAILEGFLDDPSNALAVLDYIFSYASAPDRVSIKALNYSKSEQAVIDGHAVEIPDVNNFAEYLRASGLFETVTVTKQEPSQPWRDRPQLYEFSLQCMIPRFEPKPKQRPRAALTELQEQIGLQPSRIETEYVPAPVQSLTPHPETPSSPMDTETVL